LTAKSYSGTVDVGSTYKKTLNNLGVACATSVQVRFQATDSSILSYGVTETVTRTAASTVTATLHAEGLNNGAKAGIGVGVGLGVLLLLAVALGLFFLNKRRKSRERMGGGHSTTRVTRTSNSLRREQRTQPYYPGMAVMPELEANETPTRFEMEAPRGSDRNRILGPLN